MSLYHMISRDMIAYATPRRAWRSMEKLERCSAEAEKKHMFDISIVISNMIVFAILLPVLFSLL